MDKGEGHEEKKQPPPNPPSSDAQPSIAISENKDRQPAEKRPRDWMLIFTLVIALSSIVMAVASVQQAIQTRRSNRIALKGVEISERSLERGLEQSRIGLIAASRAWLVIGDITPWIPTDPKSIRIQIKNAGPSPATIIASFALVADWEPGFKNPTTITGDIQENNSAVFVSRDSPVRLTPIVKPFTARELARLASGKMIVTLVGRIKYTDQFGNGKTDFCEWWDLESKAWVFCPQINHLE